MAGGPRERLEDERAAAASRLAGLEREFGSVVESASQANTDDEHPEQCPGELLDHAADVAFAGVEDVPLIGGVDHEFR